MRHGSFTCDMNYLYATWLIYMRKNSHPYEPWHVAWLIHMWHGSFTCDMAHSHVTYSFIHDTHPVEKLSHLSQRPDWGVYSKRGKQVCISSTCLLVNFREASLYFFFCTRKDWLAKKGKFVFDIPHNRPLLYQAVQGVSKDETFSRTVLGTCKIELSLQKSPRNPRNTQNEILHVRRTVLDKLWNFACSSDRSSESWFLYVPWEHPKVMWTPPHLKKNYYYRSWRLHFKPHTHTHAHTHTHTHIHTHIAQHTPTRTALH